MYVKSMKSLSHYKELGDEVIDLYLSKICRQSSGIPSCRIPSLYAQCFMDDNFNYIKDQRTIERLSRTKILDATLVFLPIGRHNHWSMATADMRTKRIYHEDSISGTHSDEGGDGATILKHLLEDIAKHTGEDLDMKEWTCFSSRSNKPPH